MDYVQTCIRKFHIPRYRWDSKSTQIPFLEIIDSSRYQHGRQYYPQIERVLGWVREMTADIKMVYSANNSTSEEKYKAAKEIRERYSNAITELKMNTSTMYFLLRELEKPENKNLCTPLFNILFSSRNGAFFDLVLSSKEQVGYLQQDDNGIIHLYGVNYIEVKK